MGELVTRDLHVFMYNHRMYGERQATGTGGIGIVSHWDKTAREIPIHKYINQ